METEMESNYLARLASRLGCSWAAISKAQRTSEEMQRKLDGLFLEQTSPDTSLVVFGSVARQEVTARSDLDWILLIDGQSAPEHKDQERRMELTLAAEGFIEPGKSGVFGKMVGSHDLVQNIGGEDDLNSNTTRRVLLLLESAPIGNREAYDRVRRQVLRRYIEDDRGLLHGTGHARIPRFLLNDLARYWRTVTVDFVYKQRTGDRKWALRNTKLRFSRKLLFAAGLLHCFFCHLDEAAGDARQSLSGIPPDLSPFTEYMEKQFRVPPLDILAKACLELDIKDETAKDIFDTYDKFLAILDDQSKREELTRLGIDSDLAASAAWSEIRKISGQFHEALVSLFFRDDERLKALSVRYGLF